jgi:PAS domain S-box-containing protein
MSRADVVGPGAGVPAGTLVARSVLAYAAIAALWIWGFDAVLARLALEPRQMLAIETYKGWAFVAVTSALLWMLLSRLTRRFQDAPRSASEHGSEAARSAVLLMAVSESSTDAIFAKDLEGRYLLFNREAARLTGKSIDEVLGQDDDALFDAEGAALIRANDQRVMRQLEVLTFEEELAMPGSGTKTFLSTKGPLRDAQGKVSGLFGISRDISAIARARRQVRDGERRWRRLFKSNPQPMWVYDMQTLRFLAVNEAATAHYGWSRDEFLAMTIADIRPPGEVATLESSLAGRQPGISYGFNRSGPWHHRCKDGRDIEVEVASNDIDFDGHPARFVLAVDMTERLRLERERERALRQLADVLGRITDGFFALDDGDRFVYANARAAAMMNRASPDEVLDRVFWDLFPEEVGGPFDRACREARASGQPKVDEHRSSRLGRWFEYHVYPSERGVTVYFDDVTQRHEAAQVLRDREDALRHSEQRYRLAAAGGHVWDWDIAGGRSHTPHTFWQRIGIEAPSIDKAIAVLEQRMHPDDVPRWHEALRGHIRHRRPYDLDFRMRHADGGWRWFHTQGQAVWDEDGRATYMAGTTFDVTDQRRAEESLLASQQELSELSQRLLDQERETTRRLAQVLHDRLGQTLGGARLYLDVALRSAGAPIPAPLSKLSALLDTAIAEVREVLVDLRPPLLEAQGLARSLRDEVQREAAGLAYPHVVFGVDGKQTEALRWPDDVEYAAFMVAREAVANALRHAGATTVRVDLGGDSGRLALRIRDDGVGIADHDRLGRPGHLGIVGMRERAAAVGAQLQVDNVPEGGTCVRLTWERRQSS